MKENLIFDITHYSRKSWFGRVTREIINRFIEKYKNEFNIFLVWNNVWVDKINWIKVYDYKWNYVLFKFFQLNKFLKSKKQWIFFSFDNIFFWKVKWYKYITIIHDIWQEKCRKENGISPYIKNKNFKYVFFFWLNFTIKNFYKADKVIVPSEWTKKDLINFYNLNENDILKIEVIHWWVDHFWNICINQKIWKLKILFPFPALWGWKVNQIINIINSLNFKKVDKIFFIWVRWIEKQNILNWIKNKDRIYFEENYITDEKLINYFSKKNICIYISSNDWFGFAPLECQYFWNPVLASYSTSVPYILWNSVEYVKDNDSISDIIKKMKKILENYNLYSKMSLENSKKYKWDNTVNSVYKIIKNI